MTRDAFGLESGGCFFTRRAQAAMCGRVVGLPCREGAGPRSIRSDPHTPWAARWTAPVANQVAEGRWVCMAKNPPKGPGRRGAVKQRSQFLAPNGNWAKRDASTGRIMDQKADGTPFKGVRREQ